MKKRWLIVFCLVGTFMSASENDGPGFSDEAVSLLREFRDDGDVYFPKFLEVQCKTALDAYNLRGVKAALEGGYIVKQDDLHRFNHRSRFRSLKLDLLISVEMLVLDEERVEHFRLKQDFHMRQSALIRAALLADLNSQK
jgi:hypothetical protein